MTGWATAAAATLALLLVTKLADCVSTAVRIRRADQETNPFARRLMERSGMGRTVLGVEIDHQGNAKHAAAHIIRT